MDPLLPYGQAAGLLPLGLRQLALEVPRTEQVIAEEFRLRIGCPMSITLPEGEIILPGSPIIDSNDLYSVLEIATNASAHTALGRVRQGFVTVRGGHRLGLCGNVVCKDGGIHNIRSISSMNIRIARQIPGIGDELLRTLRAQKNVPSVLVVAPPGAGKTTLLRDLIRGLSSGVGGIPLRVGVADERGELGAMWNGVPQLNLGPHTDVLDGCGKAEGLMMLLRGMNPQVLAVDEITSPEDMEAIQTAVGCGVSLLATAHGSSMGDLRKKPHYEKMLRNKIFQRLLWIEMIDGVRRYRLEEIVC